MIPITVSLTGWAGVFLTILFFLNLFIFINEFKGDFFEPIIVVVGFFTIFYFIAPAIIISTELYNQPQNIVTKALFYLSIALCFLYMGYKNNFGEKLANNIPSLSWKWNIKRAIFAISLFLFIGLAAYNFLVYLNGGFANFIFYVGNRSRLIQGRGPIRIFIDLIGLALYSSYILYQKYKKSVTITILLGILILLYSIIALTLGGRGYVLNIFITLMFIRNYIVKRIGAKALLIIVLIVPFFLNWAGTIRSRVRITSVGHLLAASVKQEYDFRKMVSLDLGRIETFMTLLERVPDYTDFYWGKTYLQSVVALVPREIYPNKPFGAAAELHFIVYGQKFHHTKNLDSPQSAASVGIIEELYLNFSIVGIILGFFIHGIILKTYYTYLLNNRNNQSVIFVYTVLMDNMIPLGNDLFSVVMTFIPNITFVTLFYLFVSQRK